MTLAGRLRGTVDGAAFRLDASGRNLTLRLPARAAALRGAWRSRRARPSLPPPLNDLRVVVRVAGVPLWRMRLA